jgi:hypothetical protein
MKVEEIIAWKRRQPFVPFALHCTDGTVYEIYDPNYVMPLKHDMVVGPQNGRRMPHHAVFVNYDTVDAIKPLAEVGTGAEPGRDTPPNT